MLSLAFSELSIRSSPSPPGSETPAWGLVSPSEWALKPKAEGLTPGSMSLVNVLGMENPGACPHCHALMLGKCLSLLPGHSSTHWRSRTPKYNTDNYKSPGKETEEEGMLGNQHEHD